MRRGVVMKRALKWEEKFFRDDGFTLIELLMVVIILGILAAVVIPQFSSSSTDAKRSVLKSNLSTIRGALELYALQHNEEYPDPNGFVNLLTKYSDKNHAVSAKNDPNYPYGPYLKHGFPKNPFISDDDKADDVKIDTAADRQIGAAVTADESTGWLFFTSTGEFIANSAGHENY